ncbi:class I SAM-dependent methyltransferase [Natrialbaceae archaeon A-CW3]
MVSVSAVWRRCRRFVHEQRTQVTERGFVDYLRSRPRALLGSFGQLLLSMDSRRMDSSEVHEKWASRSGVYSPEFYADMGATGGTSSIRSVLDARVDQDAEILELGCGGGRHLAHLHEHGYTNLSGIDINEDAVDVMEERYPELASDGTFYLDALENVLPTFEDDQFDVVFSVETLQHIHPENEWVFEEIARITDDLLLTMENEPDDDQLMTTKQVEDFPLYFRRWKPIFTDFGLTHVTSTENQIDTLRVFHQSEAEAAPPKTD